MPALLAVPHCFERCVSFILAVVCASALLVECASTLLVVCASTLLVVPQYFERVCPLQCIAKCVISFASVV